MDRKEHTVNVSITDLITQRPTNTATTEDAEDQDLLIRDDSGSGALASWWDVRADPQTSVVWDAVEGVGGQGGSAHLKDNSTAGSCQIQFQTAPRKQLYFKGMFRFAETNKRHYVLLGNGDASSLYFLFADSNGTWGHYDGAQTHSFTGDGSTYAANRWYSVEVLMDFNIGRYSVWVDNRRLGDGIEIPGNNTAMSGFRILPAHSGSTAEMWADDIALYDLSGTLPAHVPVDGAGPLISNVKATRSGTRYTIEWNTNEPATRQVEFGISAPQTSRSSRYSTFSTNHAVSIATTPVATEILIFRVISEDATGNYAVSPWMDIDVTPPSVSVSSPTANAVFTTPQTFTVKAEATDNVGVTKVWFMLNDVVVSTDTEAPYAYAWSITAANNGPHTWTATAFDAIGNSSTTDPVSVTVNIGVTNLSVALSTPTAGTTFTTPQTVPVRANATGAVCVTKVWFLQNGVVVSTDTTDPYAYDWTITTAHNGAYNWKATAFDANGNSSTTATVPVTVDIDVTKPSVTLSTPTVNAVFATPQTFTVKAAATDNVGVTKVWFMLNDVVVSTDTEAPYEHRWIVTESDNGVHTWSARAFDAAGNSTLGASVTITVSIHDTTHTVDTGRAYPNPFQPGHGAPGITFDQLPEGTRISILTIQGRPVRTLTVNNTNAVLWDMSNDDGQSVASGVYVAVSEKDGAIKRIKLVVQN